jgi:hypothetical protein
MDFLRDLVTFLWAVVNNWAGYATGGLIVALIWLRSILQSDWKPSQRLSLGWVALFLFLASFQAWRDQHRAVADSNRELAKAKDESTPKLAGEIMSLITSDMVGQDPVTGAREQHVGLLIPMQIRNTGASSIADSFSLTVELPGGERVTAVPRMLPASVNLKGLNVTNADMIGVKTAEDPITKGGAKSGYLFFFVDNAGGAEKIRQPDTVLLISFKDVLGKTVTARKRVGDYVSMGAPIYVPGTTLPSQSETSIVK